MTISDPHEQPFLHFAPSAPDMLCFLPYSRSLLSFSVFLKLLVTHILDFHALRGYHIYLDFPETYPSQYMLNHNFKITFNLHFLTVYGDLHKTTKHLQVTVGILNTHPLTIRH